MKKGKLYFAIFFLALFGCDKMFSQTPSFKWVLGSKTFNQSANYGTKGVSASINIPGARENSMSWTDQNNNLWLFGGHGYNESTNQGVLNDLWKYNVTTNQWTWISGSNTFNQAGVYGTQGTPDANNIPSARQNGVTWVDNDGNLWLFGGQKSGTNTFLNDLWKYDIATNMWTWVSGSNTSNQTSTYGTQNLASANNFPGARFGSCGWKDASNNLWLFGGQQYTSATERTNDLWKYSITTNMWTWVLGANTPNQNGNYGSKGITASTNVPGARQASITWVDNSGIFWMHGGYGFPETGAHSYLNDLWKFDANSNQWTWVSGSNTTNQGGVYGTSGIASANNLPGARQMSIAWKDLSGDLWLFGGWGYVGPPFGRLNDLWKYNITTNQWTWMAGANAINQSGTYGTMGVGATTNISGARRMSISWTDNTGKLWAFGGNGYDDIDSLGLLNDLWMIDIGVNTSNNSDTFKTNSIKIYPNPTNSLLYISGINAECIFQVFDIRGRKVITLEKINSNEIDVSSLENGTYFIKIIYKNENDGIIKFLKE